MGMRTTLLFLFITTFCYTQEKCNFVCHNGKVVKALNETSLNGHLQHGDIFLGRCVDFTGEVEDDCRTLLLPKLDFTKPLPIGSNYALYDISGRLLGIGVVEHNFLNRVPKKGIYLIKVDGYEIKRIVRWDNRY